MELFDFADNGWTAGNRQLMKVVDQVNRRFPEAIAVAAAVDKSWKPKASHASQRYTTDWRELILVK
jgi:DNA polymerase V